MVPVAVKKRPGGRNAKAAPAVLVEKAIASTGIQPALEK